MRAAAALPIQVSKDSLGIGVRRRACPVGASHAFVVSLPLLLSSLGPFRSPHFETEPHIAGRNQPMPLPVLGLTSKMTSELRPNTRKHRHGERGRMKIMRDGVRPDAGSPR